MSGEGCLAADPGVQTWLEPGLCAETIACERTAVKAHAVEYRDQVQKLVAKGRMSAVDATLICEQVEIFAEAIVVGLHTRTIEPRAVRVAVRAALSAAGLDGRVAA